MEFDEWREPIEFFLLGLDEHFPEDVSMAMCCMWTQVDIIDNDILNKVQDKKFGKVDPDFFDENERPRLRLSTIARITGIPQRLLEDSRIADFGSDKFRDAADFIRLTREKYSEADGKMREMYLRAWNDFYEGRIQVASATPSVLNRKARCVRHLALYPPQMRGLCTTRTLLRKNAITFGRL